jgi:hypothetical protein
VGGDYIRPCNTRSAFLELKLIFLHLRFQMKTFLGILKLLISVREIIPTAPKCSMAEHLELNCWGKGRIFAENRELTMHDHVSISSRLVRVQTVTSEMHFLISLEV